MKKHRILFFTLLLLVGCNNKGSNEVGNNCDSTSTYEDSNIESFNINNQTILLTKEQKIQSCNSMIQLNLEQKKDFFRSISGVYEINDIEDIVFYQANFSYDIEYIREYIVNKITRNKDNYRITIDEDGIRFSKELVEIKDLYVSYRKQENNAEVLDFNINYYDLVDSDFPVSLAFKSNSMNNQIHCQILMIIEEFEEQSGYEYQFISKVLYTKY